MNARPMDKMPLAFHPHNHKHCMHDALTLAATLCKERSVRLTPLRKQVLTLIWQNHKPLSAYALIDLLAAESSRQIAPPTVYRALDFLLAQGLIHRLDTINAFIGCPNPTQQHPSAFLFCEGCGRAEELQVDAVTRAIAQATQQSGFIVQKQSIEVLGLCRACRGDQ